MNRTVTIESRSYTIAPMKFGQGRDIFRPDADAFAANCAMTAACLNNAKASINIGGTGIVDSHDGPWTAADVQDLPYADGQALVLACMEINGLKSAKGEAPAAQAKA